MSDTELLSDTPATSSTTVDELKKNSRFNRLFSLAAIILSFVAILVSVLEVSTLRTQQKASVWPYITIEEGYSGSGFVLRLQNKGVGPALIGDVAFLYDDEPVEDIDALIAEIVGPEDAFSFDLYGMTNASREVVSAGETVTLFSVPWEDRTRLLVDTWNGRIDIRTCYCSIYTDCWDVSLLKSDTSSVKTCANAPSP